VNLAETHRLLTAIAAVDNRRFDDATVAVWRQILVDQQFDDCALAAVEHFREEPDAYLMPGHIHRRAAALARRRAGAIRRAELDAQLAIEAGETVDKTADVIELVEALAARMGTGDPDVLRRPEWVRRERQRTRELREGPNPLYDPQRAARLAREASA
jgi:hypothetical protein